MVERKGLELLSDLELTTSTPALSRAGASPSDGGNLREARRAARPLRRLANGAAHGFTIRLSAAQSNSRNS